MSDNFEPKQILSHIDLPTQDIDFLVFSSSSKVSDVEQWASKLKPTQVSQTSAALYRAIPQVLRLTCDNKSRFDMLEILMPHVRHAIYGLTKQFLNQPLILPEGVQKTAIIAQALQKNMLDGYTICARDAIADGKLKEQTKTILTTSLQRALDSTSSLILRSAQLHSPVPPGVWLRAHTLYLTAEHYDLHQSNNPTSSANYNSRNIQDAYVRCLVMGCSNLNQTIQKDVFILYKALNTWSRFITLTHDIDIQATQGYVVNLHADKAPIRKDRVDSETSGRFVEIHFSKLTELIESHTQSGNNDISIKGAKFNIPTDISNSLLSHLVNTWLNAGTRHSKRRSSKHSAEICIGLSECHALLAGNTDFESFLTECNDQSEDSDSILGNLKGFNAIFSNKDEKADNKNSLPSCTTVLVKDLSTEGYCLSWECDKNARIEAGDIVAIKEQSRRSWGLGVIRWVRKKKNNCMIGVKLLSSRPEPYAAAIMYDEGGFSDFMRAFYLPESTQPSQPATIVTASVPFKEGARIKLKQDERTVDARLDRSLISTSKIQQFDYRTTNTQNN